MPAPKHNPYEVTGELIANAIQTARVFGENRRISHLVAGSVKRFMDETADDDAAEALLEHAVGCISPEDAGHVPMLFVSLRALSETRG